MDTYFRFQRFRFQSPHASLNLNTFPNPIIEEPRRLNAHPQRERVEHCLRSELSYQSKVPLPEVSSSVGLVIRLQKNLADDVRAKPTKFPSWKDARSWSTSLGVRPLGELALDQIISKNRRGPKFDCLDPVAL